MIHAPQTPRCRRRWGQTLTARRGAAVTTRGLRTFGLAAGLPRWTAPSALMFREKSAEGTLLRTLCPGAGDRRRRWGQTLTARRCAAVTTRGLRTVGAVQP